MTVRSLVEKALVASAIVGLIWVLVLSAGTSQRGDEPIIGTVERVTITTPEGNEVEVIARVDTGADLSSVDEAFALSLGFQPGPGKVVVITDRGREERATANMIFMLAGRRFVSTATLADRSAFSTRVLIGRQDLAGFRIDPAQEFLTEPGSAATPPLPFFPGLTDRTRIEKFIVIIPILGSIVVLLRILIGVRTYGIFGPVVIALTLINLSIVQGILIYVLLLAIGIAAQLLLLSRLRLAHIAQFCLTMFVLVLAMVGISAVPGFFVPLTGVFFPLIITSHLIEQASRTIEEHKFTDSVAILFTTLATATVLAIYGAFLLDQTFAMLWAAFGLSTIAVVAAGYYLGLRLTEVLRFKFLRKTHVHK